MAASALVKLVTQDAQSILALDLHLSAEQAAKSGVTRSIQAAGALISPRADLSPWLPLGTTIIADSVHVYGPTFTGENFFCLAETSPRQALAAIGLLCQVAAKIPQPLPDSILVAPDGALLVLPEALVSRALQASGTFTEGSVRWTKPSLKGEAARVFTLAALAYRVLSGRAPFSAPLAEHVTTDIEDGNALPLQLARPEIHHELARTVDNVLGLKTEPNQLNKKPAQTVSAAKLASIIGAALDAGLETTLSPAEQDQADKNLAHYETARQHKTKTRRFFRKNNTIIAAVGLTIIIAGLITWNIAATNAARFTTKGLGPEQVVRTYYDAFNQLDIEKMEACVEKKAGKIDLDGAISMQVIFKVRSAYETKSITYLPAQKWLDSGSPKTETAIFGLVNITIEKTAQPEIFIARYGLYYPNHTGVERVDTLTLQEKKGLWKINRIEREQH